MSLKLYNFLLQLLNSMCQFGYHTYSTKSKLKKHFKDHNKAGNSNSNERLPEINTGRQNEKVDHHLTLSNDALNLQNSKGNISENEKV